MSKIQNISPEKLAIAINTLRGEFTAQQIFDQKKLVELLKRYGIPASSNYFLRYVKYGIINREKRGEYHFSATPVYKGTVEQALLEARNACCPKKPKQEQIQQEPDHSEEEKIQAAISFLKEKGFLILKQV